MREVLSPMISFVVPLFSIFRVAQQAASVLVGDAAAVLVGGAVIVLVGGAAALYTMWKLLSTPEEDQGDRTTFTPASSREFQNARRQKDVSLQSVLTDFVKMRLGVSGKEKHEVLQVSEQVAACLKKMLKQKATLFDFPSDPDLIGSSSDGTMIQRKGDCDYLLVMKVPSSSGYSKIDHLGEGYWRLRVQSPTEQMKKLTVTVTEDDYIYNSDYHCLSPLKVHAYLQRQVDKVLYKLTEIKGVVEVRHVSHQAGPALKFSVTYSSRNGNGREQLNSFDMDFVPCFLVDRTFLVGKRHPSLPYYHEQTRKSRSLPETLQWRKSCSLEERDKIAPLDKGNGGWSKKVYRLVKFLRYHHPQFRHFSSFIYKNAFLYLLDEHSYPSQWREQKLAARFLDFMKKLEECFDKGELNHYFLYRGGIKRNLLKPDYDDYLIREFHTFLRHKNYRGEAAWAELFENQ